jgi:hypothetical protein
MAIRFDLHQLRVRFARLGRHADVVSYTSQPYRWLLVRYLIGLTAVGYLYFLEGLFVRVLGPFGVLGVGVTLLLPVPYAGLAVWVERRRLASAGARLEAAP